MATAKQIFQRLAFIQANQKLVDSLDELQKVAKYAFGIAAQAIIEKIIYAKMPPHLKKSMIQALLENGKNVQIVTHIEKELELNGLEALDELRLNTMNQHAPDTHDEKPKPTCHHCKKPENYKN